MTRNQRLGFLAIAVAIAVAAVLLFTVGGADDENAGPAAGTATATATATAEPSSGEEATPEPTATPRPKPPLVTGDGVKELTFKEGDTVRFRVRAAEAEEVHVHGYDIAKDVAAGETVTFSFKATITGIFEVEFEQSGEQIAELKVEPK